MLSVLLFIGCKLRNRTFTKKGLLYSHRCKDLTARKRGDSGDVRTLLESYTVLVEHNSSINTGLYIMTTLRAKTSIVTSLVAIYFSETSNICPVRVSNREIWHRHG